MDNYKKTSISPPSSKHEVDIDKRSMMVKIDVAKDSPNVIARIFQEGRIVSYKEVEVTLKSPEDGVIGEDELKRLEDRISESVRKFMTFNYKDKFNESERLRAEEVRFKKGKATFKIIMIISYIAVVMSYIVFALTTLV